MSRVTEFKHEASQADHDRSPDVSPVNTGIGAILDTVDVPILVIGRNGAVVHFNRAATDALGVTGSDIGRGAAALGALAGVKDVEKLCAGVIADEAPRRRDVRSGDRDFMLRVAPYTGSSGEVAGAVLTFTNVTAFRASLDQAVYEREYTKAILNTVMTPLVVLDVDLRVRTANRAFYEMFGVSREKTNGVPLRTLGDDAWHASGLWASLGQTLRDEAPFQAFEIERDFPGVGLRTVLLDARRVSRAGEASLLLAMQDITEHRRTEEKLRDTDRRKDEFLALLSHELRNPLAPVRTGLELLRVSGDTPQAVGRVRAMMERQIVQMTRLIDDLLDVSRITSGKIVLKQLPTALRDLIESAIEAQRGAIDAAEIELTVDLPAAPCVIDVDAARFVQVLSNILHNAAKFTPSRGKVRIAAEPRDRAHPPHVVLTVSDTGAGITKELLPHVFDLFVQAEPATTRAHGGLGIGLALARRLVELHGGEIAAHSDGPGLGSTFIIRMPVSPADPSRTAIIPNDGTRVASRVLVIDDNGDAANTLAMLIEQLGGSARVAHDAESGLQAAQDFRPDIVFLDIGMPRMNGYDVCRLIRQQPAQRHTLIVAITGWGQEQDKQRSLDAGFDAHLLKPVDPAVLQRLLTGVSSTLP